MLFRFRYRDQCEMSRFKLHETLNKKTRVNLFLEDILLLLLVFNKLTNRIFARGSNKIKQSNCGIDQRVNV